MASNSSNSQLTIIKCDTGEIAVKMTASTIWWRKFLEDLEAAGRTCNIYYQLKKGLDFYENRETEAHEKSYPQSSPGIEESSR